MGFLQTDQHVVKPTYLIPSINDSSSALTVTVNLLCEHYVGSIIKPFIMKTPLTLNNLFTWVHKLKRPVRNFFSVSNVYALSPSRGRWCLCLSGLGWLSVHHRSQYRSNGCVSLVVFKHHALSKNISRLVCCAKCYFVTLSGGLFAG